MSLPSWVRAFLSEQFEDYEIRGLCDTVTGRLVEPTSRDEAVDAILSHSESLQKLLNRQKCTKEKLLKFAIKHDIASVKSTMKKDDIIANLIEDAPKIRAMTARSSPVQPISSVPSHAIRPIPVPQIQPHRPQQQAVLASPQSTQIAQIATDAFYSTFTTLSDLPSDYFFSSGSLDIQFNTGTHEHHEGKDVISQRFTRMKREEGVALMKNSMQVKDDAAGLVLVVTKGTVQQRGKGIIGTFEQLFSLAQDTYDPQKAYRIQRSDLRVMLANSGPSPHHQSHLHLTS